MRIFEIGTGYTSIPADKGAATEIVVENLSRALIARGHDVTVVDIADPRRLPTELPVLEVPMPRGFGATDEALGLRHKLKRVVYSVRLAGTLRRVLEEAEGKVVLHFHNQYNAYFFYRLVPARLRERALVCYTNHSGAWNGEWTEIAATIKRRYFQEAYSQKHADAVLVLNEKTGINLVEHLGIDAERVHLASNGVDTDTYRPLSRDERDTFKAKLLAPGARFVFQCGSVCENKGQLVTLRCLSHSLDTNPNCYFVFAGGVIDSGYLGGIMEYAKSAGLEHQVVYLGEMAPGPELARLYAASDVCVLPSGYEGFSMAALEALSCGTPVLQSSSNRVIGFASEEEGLFRFSDESEYSALMERFLKMPDSERGELSTRSRQCAEDRYAWTRVAGDLTTLLERIV